MGKTDGGRRRRSDKQKAIRDQLVEAQVVGRVLATVGAEAAQRWLRALGLADTPRWYAEIVVHADGDSRFELNVYPEEWGFSFHHAQRTSWIRITDVPFVHGRDDLHLLAKTPDLLAIAALLVELEQDHGVSFRRATANVRTNIPNAEPVVRDWLMQPLPFSTVKKTVELCGNQLHAGIHCTKPADHDGDHEYLGHDGTGQVRWK